MDLAEAIREIKSLPGFSENVGMLLIHNGVVRKTSRQDSTRIGQLQVTPNYQRIAAIQQEYEARQGIFKILIHAKKGVFSPGEDLMYIIVAGDFRENVSSVLSEVLNRVKEEALDKCEFF